jgi:dTDP-4-dehydrorhamnose 3,5-epimerase
MEFWKSSLENMEKIEIKDVFLSNFIPFFDNRGSFRRHFCKNELKKKKINFKVIQSNISENFHKGTLRGFHYQISPFGEAKYLSCLKGEIFDIVVDLRKNSKTYLKWKSFLLKENDYKSLHVPKGCAHAFITLKKNTIVHYYCSQKYSPKHERGIRYNDPSFNFQWPIKIKHISEKDKNHFFYKK